MMIHIITGQTATGKTKHALKLAKQIDGELINADARQLYKRLNIVTGKDLHRTTGTFNNVTTIDEYDIGYYPLPTSPAPTGHPLPEGGSRLWLYDIVDPKKPFSTHDYKTCAQYVINDIESRGKVPIIVGGSYFYIQHLLYDIVDDEVPPNNTLRQELKNASVTELQETLKKLNADLFEELNNSEQHNPQRLIRRIEKEMYELKHPPQSPLKGGANDLPFEGSTPEHSGGRDVEYKITGFQFEKKDDLLRAITARVNKRIRAGAIDETKQLLDDGYKANDPGMKTIGYTQIIQYLNNELTRDQMKEVWITKEVQYAKRQLTFMKRDKSISWVLV